MRKSILFPVLFLVSLLMITGRSSALVYTTPIMPETPLGKLKISEFIRLNPTEVGRLSGHRLTLTSKVSLGILKHKMRKSLRKKGDQTVQEFLIGNRWPNKWWHYVLLIGLAIIGIIAIISVASL